MRKALVMTGMRALVACLMCVAVAAAGTPAGDPAARQLLEDALRTLGGRERLEALPAWYAVGVGRENLSGERQGLSPDAPTWRHHEERVAFDVRTGTAAWERRTPRNDGSLRWRRFVRGRDSSGVFDWNSGRGSRSSHGTPEADRRSLARRFPHLLLLELRSRASRLESRGTRREAGRIVDVLAASLPEGVDLELAFRRAPVLLERVRYLVRLPGTGLVPVDWRWFGWRADPRCGQAPSGHRVDVDGVTFQTVNHLRYGPDAADAGELLAVPPDVPKPASTRASRAKSPGAKAAVAKVRSPERADAPPVSGEVAPGVHVLEFSGFGVLVAEFRDFLFAMEAPEHHPGLEGIPASTASGSVSADFLEELRRRWPEKPVRWLAVSHHHSDHLGGAGEFARAGATLLVPAAHVAAARRAIAERAPESVTRVEAVRGTRTITDGERTLRLVEVGRNPHTNASLFAWFPAERVLFQGDLFYFQEGGKFPPSGRETMNRFFARWLRDRGYEPRAVYGVHGRGAATAAELEAMRAR